MTNGETVAVADSILKAIITLTSASGDFNSEHWFLHVEVAMSITLHGETLVSTIPWSLLMLHEAFLKS